MIFKPYFGDFEMLTLFRLGGAGLGNLLFPLSRAYIYSLKFKGVLMPPIWPSLKIGPIIRGEKEKRTYIGMFKPTLSIRLNLGLINLLNRSIKEHDFLLMKPSEQSQKNATVVVAGLRNLFSDLLGYNDQLLAFFLSISSKKVIDLYQNFNSENIGVHIRLGDYNESVRTPLEWYESVILKLQESSKYKHLNFIVFSDGNDDDLKTILCLPNCIRIQKADALADILRLSKCQIIVGSNSTFSAWSAFLGNKPFLRHNKFYLKKIHIDERIYEGDSAENFLMGEKS